MYEYDPCVERIAVVGNEKWKDEMLMFFRVDRRQASVRFFPPGGENEARDWLDNTKE
jgi:hypothetical protein